MTLPGGPELIVVLIVFVLLFGAKKLPELGSSVGKSIQNFKRGMAEANAEDTDADAETDDSTVDNAQK
ncbi:MAG TPA: twin-arginine translocase TatA/TatE family subunit [Euzebyales bacterium]|nr:twin-arginine translocase TatA/TatE family subunit [Euzebyales bacterium]